MSHAEHAEDEFDDWEEEWQGPDTSEEAVPSVRVNERKGKADAEVSKSPEVIVHLYNPYGGVYVNGSSRAKYGTWCGDLLAKTDARNDEIEKVTCLECLLHRREAIRVNKVNQLFQRKG